VVVFRKVENKLGSRVEVEVGGARTVKLRRGLVAARVRDNENNGISQWSKADN
jgi:hypothetical protein